MDKMMRIRGEIPTFKRCCVFLPLRLGLIMWGYIRLVIGVILLVGVTNDFLVMLEITKIKEGYEIYVALYGFFVTLAGADIVLNVVFVYGGHKKDLKMLRAYYIYSFILWILMIIMWISLFTYALYIMNRFQMEFHRSWYILLDLVTFLAHIVIQAYVILLVRSEFLKLSNDCEFRFVNNAAESACEMKICEVEDVSNENYRNITVKSDVIVTTDIIADGNVPVNRNLLANGDTEGVYKNGTSEANTSKLKEHS